MIYLRKKDKFLSDLSFYWLIISFLVFSFFVLAGRNHLMDFIWLLILFVALGLVYLFDIIKNHFKLEEKKAELFGIIMIGLLLYHLVLVNHVLLGRQYDKDSVPRSMAYAQEIKNLEIQDRDTIAIPGDFPSQETTLNYLTDKSFIIFRSSTLSKLLKEDKAKQALEAFGVKYILGYSDELSKELVEKAGTTNIASNSLKIDIEEASQNKSFLMNLVR